MTDAGKRLQELAETATPENVGEHLAEARRIADQAEPAERFWIESLVMMAEAVEITEGS